MEFQQNTPAQPGVYACDADLFERVWERVGAQDRPDCPVERAQAAGWEESAMSGQENRSAQPSDLSAEVRAGEEELGTDAQKNRDSRSEDDFPTPDDLPCLGRSSANHQGQLQQYIKEELEGWQLYRHLARKVNGPHAKTLAALASEKHRQARRLAAAHFLIAGVRYWPTDKLETPRFSSWLGTLRERFSAEQRHQHRYRAAAYDTADPCLAELYSELAEECGVHANLLRRVLEGAL